MPTPTPPAEKNDAPLMLSVSGMRGLVGRSFTPPVVCRYAAALGDWIKTTRGVGHPTVVVGRDSRPSGELAEHAAVSALVAVGCRVVRLGVVSTPGVAVMVRHLEADGGLVITASHNPLSWNGLKPLRHDAVAPPADQAQAIIDAYHADAPAYAAVEDLQPVTLRHDTADLHRDAVLKIVSPHAVQRGLNDRPLRVVVDSVHGAGFAEALSVLEALGVEVIPMHAEPTGLFPHPPEPVREHLTGLCDAVTQHDADLGFAQDPDADRLAVVDEQGVYIGEEYTLALSAMHLLTKTNNGHDHDEETSGSNASGGGVVVNLSTSRMIDDIAHAAGARVVRTPVGEANVADAMREHHLTLGGEGNGGIIHAGVSQVRDSVLGMAVFCEMLATRQSPLSQIVASTPAYAIVKDKLPAPPASASEGAPGMIDDLESRLRAAFPDADRFDAQDGVRVDWPDRWVHVRPSNTEPILRLIVEASDQNQARALIEKVRQLF